MAIHMLRQTADIQLDPGIAVRYPQFGDVATSIQSTWSAEGAIIICREGYHDGSTQQNCTLALQSQFILHRTK